MNHFRNSLNTQLKSKPKFQLFDFDLFQMNQMNPLFTKALTDPRSIRGEDPTLSRLGSRETKLETELSIFEK